MAKTFYRMYKLIAGKQGAKGFSIGNETNETATVLRIAFDIEKADTETPNNAKIQIWNLAPENRKSLEQKDCYINLKAGYKGSLTQIFHGDVVLAVTKMDGADRITELDVADGNVKLRDTYIKISMKGKVNTKTLYTMAASKMGLSYSFAKGLKFKTIKKGFSYTGKAASCLSKLVAYNGHAWTIQNGVLQFTKKGGAIGQRQYLLNKDTGLIGIPEKIVITDGEKSQTGYEVQYFLNGAIGVNDLVKIESEAVKGEFRVRRVQMQGDNYEGDWMCTAQVTSVAVVNNSKG